MAETSDIILSTSPAIRNAFDMYSTGRQLVEKKKTDDLARQEIADRINERKINAKRRADLANQFDDPLLQAAIYDPQAGYALQGIIEAQSRGQGNADLANLLAGGGSPQDKINALINAGMLEEADMLSKTMGRTSPKTQSSEQGLFDPIANEQEPPASFSEKELLDTQYKKALQEGDTLAAKRLSELKQKAEAKAPIDKFDSLKLKINNIQESIDQALSLTGDQKAFGRLKDRGYNKDLLSRYDSSYFTGGITGALTGFIPGSAQDTLENTVLTIKANLGFDELQKMRDASPTGGALGQVAIQELEALQSTVASLKPTQDPMVLGNNIEKIKKHYDNWLGVLQEARKGRPQTESQEKNQIDNQVMSYEEFLK